jgi:hypothetical protein
MKMRRVTCAGLTDLFSGSGHSKYIVESKDKEFLQHYVKHERIPSLRGCSIDLG